ncbi:hypothetical protein AVEN_177166-1 [Araneus ventricosus]|uniref:Uncharacterized protein n=1 Tax=Araneus ventricosus TaxID=182803 RepID=A0A4Y2TXD1_ARAVE|nr:hypothetical protein AVEN_177166-1 [Araneus ventricosus]
MTYKKADEDADCLIVKSIALASTHPSVVVIGEDIELLVTLIGICTFDKNPDMTPEAVVDVGNSFLVALYGYPITTSDTPSLNNVCYKCYMKSSFKKNSNMASLRSCPPSFPKSLLSDSGNKKRPEDWGF